MNVKNNCTTAVSTKCILTSQSRLEVTTSCHGLVSNVPMSHPGLISVSLQLLRGQCKARTGHTGATLALLV